MQLLAQKSPAYTFDTAQTYLELHCPNCSEYADFTLRYQTTIPSALQKVPMQKVSKGHYRQHITLHQPQFGLVRMGIGLTIPFYALPGDTLRIHLTINNFDIIQELRYEGNTAPIADYFWQRQQIHQYPETAAKLYQLKYVSRKDSMLQEERAFLEKYAATHPQLPEWFVRTERAEKQYFRIWDTQTLPLQEPEALFAKQYFNYLGLLFKNQIPPEIIQLADDETRAKAILETFLNKADSSLSGEVRDVFKTLTLTTWLPKIHNLAYADSLLTTHQSNFTQTKYHNFLQDFREQIIRQGLIMPDFAYLTPDDSVFRLSSLRGKVMYLNFWFVGCKPCMTAIPYKNRLVEALEPEEAVLVNICFYGTPQKWKDEIAAHQMKGLHLFVPPKQEREVLKDFRIAGFPFYVLVDKEGIIYMQKAPGPTAVLPKIQDVLTYHRKLRALRPGDSQ
ncbi:MAG: TlpA family protein disulfide reductase [Bernardetiaceae bacterium]